MNQTRTVGESIGPRYSLSFCWASHEKLQRILQKSLASLKDPSNSFSAHTLRPLRLRGYPSHPSDTAETQRTLSMRRDCIQVYMDFGKSLFSLSCDPKQER